MIRTKVTATVLATLMLTSSSISYNSPENPTMPKAQAQEAKAKTKTTVNKVSTNTLVDKMARIIEEESSPKLSPSRARSMATYIVAINKLYAQKYGFKDAPETTLAFIRTESEFNPRCTSSAGAKGLMQLMTSTGREYAKKLGYSSYDPYSWKQNIAVGWYYYNVNAEKLGKDKAIVAYNQGYRNLKKAVAVSRGQSRSYLNKVKGHETRYRGIK